MTWKDSWRYEEDKKSEDLIHKYRQTQDDKYLSLLVDSFNPFLKKYVKLLKYGQFYPNDKDVLYVLSFFHKDKKNLTEVSNYISGFFFRWDIEDIWQEIRRIFLHQVKLYKKKKNVGFNGYIYNTFHYRIKNLIVKVSREPLNIPGKVWLCESVGEYHNDKIMFEDEIENKVWMESFLSDSDLDFLNKSFLDGYSDIKIGEMFKCHRNTVAQRKKNLSEKIAKEYIYSKLI